MRYERLIIINDCWLLSMDLVIAELLSYARSRLCQSPLVLKPRPLKPSCFWRRKQIASGINFSLLYHTHILLPGFPVASWLAGALDSWSSGPGSSPGALFSKVPKCFRWKTQTGFTGPKSFRGFHETGPWPWTLCSVLGQDHSASLYSGVQMSTGVILRWTSIPYRGE